MDLNPLPPPSTSRLKVGRLLDSFGQLMLPTAVGAMVGFYVADRGMRLLPTLLEILLAWTLVALLLMLAGRLLRGRTFQLTPEGRRVRTSVVVVLWVTVLALMARLGVWYVNRPSDLTRLEPAAFEEAFEIDAEQYLVNEAAMERLLGRLEQAGLPRTGDDAVLSPDEERLLLDSFAAFRDHAIALDRIRAFWEDWYRYDPSRVERTYHLRSFLLTYAAELALYEKAARLVGPLLDSPNAKKFLDAPHPELGLAEGSLSHLREDLLGSRDEARVVAGETYLRALATGLGARNEAASLGVAWLWSDVDRHLSTIAAVAPIDRAELTVRADSQLLKRSVRRVWFPIQKEVAETMGDVRTRRIGWYLIPPEQQEEADKLLVPGDILVARKNWYLSNVGLPGFWPHGILYVGDPDKLAAWSDDDGIRAWLEERTGQDLSFPEWLAHRFPTEWARYRLGVDDHPVRVIEAISEGVVLNSFPHVAGDYLGAVRPRRDKVAKAQAIEEAFAQLGKPYDFDFDFATDHAVVCTELVWRAWRPAPGKEGVEIPLVRTAGRSTLPANEVVAFYDRQADAGDARVLDFVLFIDAREKEQVTAFSDEAAFRASWKRTKWDFAQQ